MCVCYHYSCPYVYLPSLLPQAKKQRDKEAKARAKAAKSSLIRHLQEELYSDRPEQVSGQIYPQDMQSKLTPMHTNTQRETRETP